ncbi:MAG: hypothetical protein ABR976_11610 [Terracidiphilus sp.]|jgi:hypothetical protein
MKTRYLMYPALTGLIAAMLMLFAISAAGTSNDWLPTHLFLPGQVLTAFLFPHHAGAPVSPLRFFAEFALNFLMTWIMLAFAAFFLDKLTATLIELTKL